MKISCFYKQPQNKDGRHRWCKTCVDAYQAEYYKKNKTKLQKRSRRLQIIRRRKRQLFVLKYLQNHPCIDCGEQDPIVLEFDHIRGEKIDDISGMIESYSESNLIKEIEKCEVRCANCHKKKTAIQFGWYDYIDFKSMTIKHNKPK